MCTDGAIAVVVVSMLTLPALFVCLLALDLIGRVILDKD